MKFLPEKFEKELWKCKIICLLGTKAPTGLNVELKHYGRELYEVFTNLYCFIWPIRGALDVVVDRSVLEEELDLAFMKPLPTSTFDAFVKNIALKFCKM